MEQCLLWKIKHCQTLWLRTLSPYNYNPLYLPQIYNQPSRHFGGTNSSTSKKKCIIPDPPYLRSSPTSPCNFLLSPYSTEHHSLYYPLPVSSNTTLPETQIMTFNLPFVLTSSTPPFLPFALSTCLFASPSSRRSSSHKPS